MRKFGLGKKGDRDDDSNRLALFGSRSKNKSPAPPSSNPYAQPAAPPDPYTQAKINAGVMPPQSTGHGSGRGPSPGPPLIRGQPDGPASRGAYGGLNRPVNNGPPTQGYGSDNKYMDSNGGGYGSGGGYGADKYASQSGYGADRYGGGQQQGGQQGGGGSRYGAGGYGGLGRTNSNETTNTDANRDELFGGAKDRFQQKQQTGYGQPPPTYDDPNGGAQSFEGGQNYGAYQDRQLTAEEEEEEDITATKQEIRFMKQQDVSSTRNALRVAAMAEETGRNTLARLGAQGESIHNTEKNLDIAANQNRTAEEKARELKTLNKSMFAVHVGNPFTSAQRRERRDEEIINRHREERDQRESSRQAAFQSGQRMEETFRGFNKEGQAAPKGKSTLAERAKYQFENDSEDDEMENELDSNIDALSGAAGRLNMLARATGKEVEEQNKHLERITGKVRDPSHQRLRRLPLADHLGRATLWTIRFI